MATRTLSPTTLLHTRKLLPRAWVNRSFAFVYATAIFFLFYHHFLNLIIHSPPKTLITIFLVIADLVLSFMWITYQAFQLNPIQRQVFPENLPQVVVPEESEYPALDVFICTADPYKEPPLVVVNTALSLLTYDYPAEKLSVYVSDDGGSQLTLFAFMEAAKFAKYWLPYCKKNNVVDTCPEVYFESNHDWLPETTEIKLIYDKMKEKVKKVVEQGSVCPDFISDVDDSHLFTKWTTSFTLQHHPPIIQVLLDGKTDKNIDNKAMPNLIYVSREKSRTKQHNFKAGALNVLLRVSASMTNAPIVLAVDCDMNSNDPTTPLRALCYFVDPYMDANLAFVQFPQRFRGINKDDIYNGEFRLENKIDTIGLDGLMGPMFMGTGTFFRRHALSTSAAHIPHVRPIQLEDSSNLRSNYIIELAHRVAGCNYEDETKWGSEIGFRYGCLIEDMFTSFRLQCEGWRSVFCSPRRAAFLGNSPITLDDFLTQTKRWYVGFLEFNFSTKSPITFGLKSMKNPLQAICYIHYTCRPFWSIPIIIYSFLPQLMLINSFPIFPKVSDPWFFLYAFLFLGAYVKHLFDFTFGGGPILKRWWNSQRMWLLWGVSCYPFALLEFTLKSLGIATFGFNVTSKVVDKEQGKRYEQGMIEFGVASPMFFAIGIVATVNLFAFLGGIVSLVFKNGSVGVEELFAQVFLAGFVVINSWPVYEAMVLRGDQGKMPLNITLTSIAFAAAIFVAFSVLF